MSEVRGRRGQGTGRAIGRGRAVAIAFVVILAIGAGVASLELDRAREVRVASEARRQAADAGGRLLDLWTAQADSLALVAHGASSHPLLRAAVRARVDEGTLRDIVTSEEWWAPYRALFAALS